MQNNETGTSEIEDERGKHPPGINSNSGNKPKLRDFGVKTLASKVLNMY